MTKFSSLFIKNLTVTALVLLTANFTFGQDLRQDLEKSFRKFSLSRLPEDSLRGASATRRLTVQAGEKTYFLNVAPRDLRAPNYRAETTDAAEQRQALEFGGVKTFRGRIAGEENSEVRLTIDGGAVEGYFSARDEKFFIEPARRYSEFAGAADLVVYREADFINPKGFACASPLGEKLARGKQIPAQPAAESSALRVIEIATEADYDFVILMGGAAQANAEILSILNMVEGAYEQELGLSFDVVYQHAWSAPDPLNGANSNALLYSFKDYWNANHTAVSRDAAHLFTAKPNVLAQGYAFLNVICRLPDFAYGLSGWVEWVPAKYDVTAHEVGHNLNANHADEPQGCGNTIMNSVLSATTPLTFCSFSRSEITSYVSGSGSCLSPRAAGGARFDFDGDRKADATVFRPSNGIWYVLNSANNSFDAFLFGQPGDKPVPADYDGDGKTDAAVFRGGTWYRLKSTTSTFDAVSFGVSSDVPAPADFDGDGRADVAVFRPSNGYWFTLNSSTGAFVSVQFGASGDVPMPADFDGDGRADITLWRPANGIWYRLNSRDNSFFGAQFGTAGDKPVSGDFDGDGRADLAVFRPSNGYWYILNSANGSLFAAPFGVSTDLPVAADFNGDGKTDLGVYRGGIWHRFSLAESAYSAIQFGAGGDIPAPSFYVP